MQKLLIVEDDHSVRTTMVTCWNWKATPWKRCPPRARPRPAGGRAYPIVISDIYLDERTGIDVLRTARAQNPECAVILMTGRGSMETVMAATAGRRVRIPRQALRDGAMLDTIRRAEKSLSVSRKRTKRHRSTICRTRK